MSVIDKYGQPKAKTPKVSLSVKAPKDLAQAIESLSQSTGYSKSEIVVDLVREGLDRIAAKTQAPAPNRET